MSSEIEEDRNFSKRLTEVVIKMLHNLKLYKRFLD